MIKILVLGRNSASTQMLIQCLKRNAYQVHWIEERRDDKKLLLRNRVKKHGAFKVLGQLLFLVYQRYLNIISRGRKEEILSDFSITNSSPADFVTPNVNDVNAFQYITSSNPDLVVLSGTRILSPSLLASLHCPVLNIHAGINPKYRGVHGGYWALVNDDLEHCGSTIHRVDEGIDTGEVLAYATINITRVDNFVTYPLLQQKAALLLLPNIIKQLFIDKSQTLKIEMPSNIWTHPTIWQYLFYRINKGVK
jgi:folate-dependent phosphoribosylglycinamide formyltransferase PurN